MPRQIKQLVSRNLLDSLLVGISEQRRAKAAELCLECGYDPTHPHAFYPLATVCATSQALGELLAPSAAPAEQEYQVGWAVAEGYRSTVAGGLVVARRGPMPVVEIVRYYGAALCHALPGLRLDAGEDGEFGCMVGATGWGLHPALLCGVLVRMVELVGGVGVSCKYQARDELEYDYTVRWQGPVRSPRGYLSRLLANSSRRPP